MPKYEIKIEGKVDTDDPELAYLVREGPRFQSARDILEYLADILAEELAFETTDIQVTSKELDLPAGVRTLKALK